MNAKKQREKNRRRANKLAEEAWQAVEEDRVDLAVKIIERAIDLNPGNPVLWHDRGSLLVQSGDDDEAAQSFQAAIQLAPDFAEAFAALAAVHARHGQMQQAVSLQREAARFAQHVEPHESRLAAYEAMLAAGCHLHVSGRPVGRKAVDDVAEGEPAEAWPDLAAAVARLNWAEIGGHLTEHGMAHVPGFLSDENCEALRMMFADDALFAKTVTMNKPHFGKGVYRYFAAPVPPLVDAIRQLVYPRVAEIANEWQRLLACDERYPATWPAFRGRCAAAGQTTPSPLLLRYEAEGFNAPHQDLRGEVFFPLQLVIVLSRRAESVVDGENTFTGGEFLCCDQPERKASDRREAPAGLGDAVLFCTRSRLVRVGGVYGLQPVKHGLSRVAAGVRFAVGIPFHEFNHG